MRSNVKIHKKEVLKLKKDIIKDYKNGAGLHELCKRYTISISIILDILRKARIRKKKLYIILENQRDNINSTKDIITDREKKLMEKFFPNMESSNLFGGYYWHWLSKYKKTEKTKNECNHKFKHVKCAQCNKILADATNVLLQENSDYRTEKINITDEL